jgi:hypothetical protein
MTVLAPNRFLNLPHYDDAEFIGFSNLILPVDFGDSFFIAGYAQYLVKSLAVTRPNAKYPQEQLERMISICVGVVTIVNNLPALDID